MLHLICRDHKREWKLLVLESRAAGVADSYIYDPNHLANGERVGCPLYKGFAFPDRPSLQPAARPDRGSDSCFAVRTNLRAGSAKGLFDHSAIGF